MKANKNKNKIAAMEGYKDRLKEAISKTGWKQLHLANAVGLTQPRISQLLKGVRFPRIPVSQQIAFTLRVPYQWLAYGEGNFEV
jgi:transcriptional regulator with XRE-family HTH domain